MQEESLPAAPFYDAVAAHREALTVFRRYHDLEAIWTGSYDPRDGQPIRGRLERVGTSLSQDFALKIGGRWLTVRHTALVRALLQLRPEIGDEVEITCLGKQGSAYAYAVSVNGRSYAEA